MIVATVACPVGAAADLDRRSDSHILADVRSHFSDERRVVIGIGDLQLFANLRRKGLVKLNGGFAMPLQRGEILGYDFNRMVVEFTMFNEGKTVRCAISTAAMDDLEGRHDVKADQRVDQFVRLRHAIEERASRKFFEGPVEAEGPVVLRSNDFFR